MKRLRTMSQIIKALLLIYVFASGLIAVLLHTSSDSWRVFDMPFSKYSDIPAGLKVLYASATGVFLLAVIFFYRLLNLYETGTVFSLANVRHYKRLGLLAVGYGLLRACAPAVRQDLDVFKRFVIVLFEATSSPWIIGGLFVVMISLIMEEACKIREEQELTV